MTTTQWCEANGILPVHYASVQLVLSHLTLLELCSQYNALTAGFDPRKVNGYDKIEILYRRIEREGKSTIPCFDRDEPTLTFEGRDGYLVFRSDDQQIFERVLGFRLDQETRSAVKEKP